MISTKAQIRIKKIFKVTFALLWVTFFLLGWNAFVRSELKVIEIPMTIQAWIQANGVWAPILYVLIFVPRGMVFIPMSVVAILSGILFPPVIAVLLTVLGGNLSSNVNYLIGDLFGHQFMEEHETGKIKQLDEQLKKHGFMSVLAMRLFHFPFDFTAYMCGISDIRFKDYFWGNFFGMLPTYIAFALLGSAIHDPKNLVVSLAVMLGGVLALLLLRRHYHDQTQVIHLIR